ncbi:protein C10 [Coccinella septempunctata]|uniref:protein C10 n=1 Tax=Coccinella septempunctata TaxID=41139 RepID=UPI001D06A989|nr:protein C10 [Coccinella septempunctata]
MPKTEDFPALTTELAIEILNRTLETLQTPENTQKLDEARDNVGNEMLKMMQFLFPIVMQIQMDVITEFGFPEGREGIVKFAQMLRSLEVENSEVAQLHSIVRSYYLPSVAVNASPPEERLNSS